MKTNPKSEKEIQEARLMPEGEYEFLVKTASDEVSRAGNDMIKLILTVWDKKGKEHIIYDYLLAAMDYKLRHFCECTGNLKIYEDDDLFSEHCLDKSGKVLIGIKEAEGIYPSQNMVIDYVVDKSKRPGTKEKDKSLVDSPVPNFGNPPLIDESDIPM